MFKYEIVTGFCKSWNEAHECYEEHISDENGIEFETLEESKEYFESKKRDLIGEPGLYVEINKLEYDEAGSVCDCEIIEYVETDIEGKLNDRK